MIDRLKEFVPNWQRQRDAPMNTPENKIMQEQGSLGQASFTGCYIGNWLDAPPYKKPWHEVKFTSRKGRLL